VAELILTIPRSRAGDVAIEHLRERGRELGVEYRAALTDVLRGLRAGDYLRELPQSYHLVATEDGREAAATNRILAWHDGERPDWPHGRVDAVEPNIQLQPLAPLGLPFALGGDHATYLAMMRVPDAHANGVRGAGVRVAVVDSGLDPGAGVTPSDFYDVENAANLHPVPVSPLDNDGHGTAMAALIHDVAPDAEIWVVRVLDSGGLNLWNLLAGVGVAIADCEADVINLSVGFSTVLTCGVCGAAVTVRSLAFDSLASTATPLGGKMPVHVAAAGNSSSTARFDFPATSPRCVTAGAVDSARQRSLFSSYGTKHKRYLMAPGGQESAGTFTEHVGLGNGVTPCAGSSVAAAYVSGMLALFRSDARYASLGRDAFLDAVFSGHCVLPSHAAARPLEYGAGVIEYSPPSGGGDEDASEDPPDDPADYTPTIWTDGTYVYVGGVRLTIKRLKLKDRGPS
jgi:hypothetical protein